MAPIAVLPNNLGGYTTVNEVLVAGRLRRVTFGRRGSAAPGRLPRARFQRVHRGWRFAGCGPGFRGDHRDHRALLVAEPAAARTTSFGTVGRDGPIAARPAGRRPASTSAVRQLLRPSWRPRTGPAAKHARAAARRRQGQCQGHEIRQKEGERCKMGVRNPAS